MASLSAEQRNRWKETLWSASADWVVCGMDLDRASHIGIDGVAGLIDWIVHGQVSQLLIESRMHAGECCLLPGDPQKKRPSFLLVPWDRTTSPQALAECTRKLRIREFAVAESTFPEDFLAKVKQTFTKEGIRWKKLEPESE